MFIYRYTFLFILLYLVTHAYKYTHKLGLGFPEAVRALKHGAQWDEGRLARVGPGRFGQDGGKRALASSKGKSSGHSRTRSSHIPRNIAVDGSGVKRVNLDKSSGLLFLVVSCDLWGGF